nr:unnamed protein product [Digitaria exilis]
MRSPSIHRRIACSRCKWYTLDGHCCEATSGNLRPVVEPGICGWRAAELRRTLSSSLRQRLWRRNLGTAGGGGLHASPPLLRCAGEPRGRAAPTTSSSPFSIRRGGRDVRGSIRRGGSLLVWREAACSGEHGALQAPSSEHEGYQSSPSAMSASLSMGISLCGGPPSSTWCISQVPTAVANPVRLRDRLASVSAAISAFA